MDAGNLCWLERTHHTVFPPLSALTHLNRRRVKGERLIRCNATAVPHRLKFMSSIWTEAAFAVYVRFVNEICRQEGVGVCSRSTLWHIIVENLTFQSSSEHNFNCGGKFIHVKVFYWRFLSSALSQFLKKLFFCVSCCPLHPAFDWQVSRLS